jgi:hypothetical protein
LAIVSRTEDYSIEEGGRWMPWVASAREKSHQERFDMLVIMRDTVVVFEEVYQTMVAIQQLENIKEVVDE